MTKPSPTTTVLVALLLLLALALLLGPCVLTSNPVEPAPVEPGAVDDTGPADPDSTGAP